VQVVPSNGRPLAQGQAEQEPENDTDSEQDGSSLPSQVEQRLLDLVVESAPADHIYLKQVVKQRPVWIKRVQREWRMLARGLPEAIRLHVYEDRMDLMRAAMVGPKNTPYADSLFYFDILLPQDYPRLPPLVTFWAYGKRLNPNLYASGRICLSLLGTWSGSASESWQQHNSNMLQVLISILGLVLVEDPYYNEPGYEVNRGKPESEALSRKYSEEVRIMVLHSMLITPPKGFEEFAKEHFKECGTSIIKRAQRLASANTDRRVGRIDGIDIRKDAPSDSFKKELQSVLQSLKRAFPESTNACNDCSDDDDLQLPVIAKAPKLGWIGRFGLGSTMGGS
jgi:ubiquitin-conjugating enzyme E2 O